MKNIKRVLCTLFAVALLCVSGLCFAEEPYKRILFISSYSYDWPSVQLQLDGITETLTDNVELETIFMNTKRMPVEQADETTLSLVETYISQNGQYDVVIVGDDAATDFAVKYYNTVFDGVPIIFEGVNSPVKAEQCAKLDHFTGLVEKFPIEETIRLATQLYPDATNIVAISDTTDSGLGSLTQYYYAEDNFPQLKFDDINVAALTAEQLLTQVASYDENTILIYLIRSTDANGNVYSIETGVHTLTNAANVPVFKADEIGIGHGLIGGAVVSTKASGVRAAELALFAAANNSELLETNVYTMPVYYTFDYNVLERFDIKTSQLPANSKIINKPANFFEQHPRFVIGAFLFAFISAAIIVIQWISNRRKSRFAKALRASSDSLKTAIENSRMTYAEYDLEKNELHFGEKAQRVHGVPPVVYNMPEGLFETGRIMKSSEEAFAEMIDSIRQGNDRAMAQVQMYNSVQHSFSWYRVLFTLIKSSDGTVIKAVSTASDITDEKLAEKRYEQSVTFRDIIEQSTLATAHINLSKNTVIDTDKNEDCTFSRFKMTTADEFLAECHEYIYADGEDKKFEKMFSRQALLASFSDGTSRSSATYLHKGDNSVYMWRRMNCTVYKNPTSGDIEAYLYLTDITSDVLRARTYEKALPKDIDFVSYLELGTNISHCIYQRIDGGCMPPTSGDFDLTNERYIDEFIAPEDRERARQYFRRSTLIQTLVVSPVYSFTMHILDGENGEPRLKLFEISYLDNDKEAIVFIRKNAE